MTEEEKRKARLVSQVMSMANVFDYNEIYEIVQKIELSDCAQENLKKAMKKLKIRKLGLRSVV